MSSRTRSHTRLLLFLAAFAALLSISCGFPVVWNADVKSFVDDGTATVSLSNFAVQGGGATTVVPSGSETIVTLTMTNPRSLPLSCTASCVDSALLVSPPRVTVVSPQMITLAFTPALAAEHKDLVFTVTFAAPRENRTYNPQPISIHCNSRPGSVESSLDAALDASGCAFAAFCLPSSQTDNDLSQVEITWQRADGTGSAQTVALSVDDPSLLQKRLSVDGTGLLGADSPLDRYFQPTGITTGDDYVFVVVVVDTEGLGSQTATTTSNSTLYTVTYSGNGNTDGAAPVDLSTYRQTKSVTVMGPGTLARAGYSFASWNTASDGSGTAYAPGDTFNMGPGNVTLHARWIQNGTVTITFTFNPTYGAITFSNPTVSVSRGNVLQLSTSLTGATNWHWYANNVQDTTQTGPAFNWNTGGVQPGQYVINVDATYNGYPCTGSILVTVGY
jgi:hypothetical protein